MYKKEREAITRRLAEIDALLASKCYGSAERETLKLHRLLRKQLSVSLEWRDYLLTTLNNLHDLDIKFEEEN